MTILLCKGREMKAVQINKLVDEYGKDIFSFCRKITYSEEDCEDLYQDVFLKAVEKRSSIDFENNPKSYLISIAVSLWNNKKRKYARHQRIAPEQSLDSEESFEQPYHTDTPEKEVLKKELIDTVNMCISELDDKMRIPVLLYYNAQLPLEKIAEILNCSEGTVKSRLFNARQKLKKKLEVYEIEQF